MGHINTTDNDDQVPATDHIDLTEPADDAQLCEEIVLLEEKKHDADEDKAQRVIQLDHLHEEEATLPHLKQPKSTKKSKSAKAAVLVRVSKGMHFPPDNRMDPATLVEYKKRVTVHKLDVGVFFKDTELRDEYEGVCV